MDKLELKSNNNWNISNKDDTITFLKQSSTYNNFISGNDQLKQITMCSAGIGLIYTLPKFLSTVFYSADSFSYRIESMAFNINQKELIIGYMSKNKKDNCAFKTVFKEISYTMYLDSFEKQTILFLNIKKNEKQKRILIAFDDISNVMQYINFLQNINIQYNGSGKLYLEKFDINCNDQLFHILRKPKIEMQ